MGFQPLDLDNIVFAKVYLEVEELYILHLLCYNILLDNLFYLLLRDGLQHKRSICEI